MAKKIHSLVADFFQSLYCSLRFHYHKLIEESRFGKISLPYSNELENDTVIILGNGPSLREDMDGIKEMAIIKNTVFMAVNNFAISDSFMELRPQYYCIADRVYFWENYDKQASSVYGIFSDSVSWKMNLFVPMGKDDFVRNKIHNKNITIVPISTTTFEGFNKKKYPCYKNGIAVPSFVNITIMSIFLALNKGCKKIYLYGVDHTFLREIAVDDDNVLCSFDKHFYGDRLRRVQPLEDGTFMRMKDFVYDKYLTFVEHDNMRGYANYLGAEIINCTRCSCIDSYTRLAQIEKQKTTI